MDEKDEAFAYEIGADGFLRKGMDPADFLNSIQAMIKNFGQGRILPKSPVHRPEEETYKHYSERLIRKLEKKTQVLEKEVELRKQDEKTIVNLNAAVTHSPNIVMITDNAGNIEYVNPKFEEITGYTAREILGTNAASLGRQSPENLKQMFRDLQAGQVWKGIFHNRKKNGESYWERASISPMFGENGSITHFVKVGDDMTREKALTDALQEKEERLNMALEASRDGLWDWNIQTGEIYFSPRYYTMLGYEPNELPQTYDTWAGLLHPDDREAAEKSILDHIEKEFSPFEQEFRMKTRSGKWKWILGRGKVFSKDEKGRPVRIVGTHTDISRLKAVIRQVRETQKELKIRNQIARIFLTTAGDETYEKILALVLDMTQSRYGIFGFIDAAGEWVCPSLTRDIWENCQVPDKRIAFPHDTWTGIWGQAMTEKKSRYINGRLHLPEAHIDIDNALDAPVVYQDRLVGNLLVGQKDKGYTDDDQDLMEMVADQIAPVLKTRLEWDREKKERRQAETRLRQAQKLEAIGSLAGGIAHDFNNILSAIIGYAQLAMDRLPKDNPAQADLEQIYKGGERAKDLVMQILAFSRQQKQNAAPVQVGPIIKEVLKFLKSTLPRSIEIRQEIMPDTGNVLADPTQIHQVLMNLCTNAAHAMDNTSGTLTVALSEMTLDSDMTAALPDLLPGKYLKLTVGDTGHGITPDILPRIFDPYFTTKRRGQGTGLGLATVHGIIKSYGGGITVSSTPGQGTTFHLYFPVMADPDEPAPEKPATAAAAGNDASILVVDDETAIADLGKQLLEHLGYQAEARTDPLEALDLITADPDRFDLVITDLTMPGMSGDKLASELTKIRPDLPVILCSGFSRDMTKAAAEAAGIKAFVPKPILKDKLAAVIQQVLGDKNA